MVPPIHGRVRFQIRREPECEIAVPRTYEPQTWPVADGLSFALSLTFEMGIAGRIAKCAGSEPATDNHPSFHKDR